MNTQEKQETIDINSIFSKLEIQRQSTCYLSRSSGATVSRSIQSGKWELISPRDLEGCDKGRKCFIFDNLTVCKDFMHRKGLLLETETLTRKKEN